MCSSLFVLLWPRLVCMDWRFIRARHATVLRGIAGDVRMAYAKPLLALQQSLMMHSGTPADSLPDDCSLDAQKRYRQSIELRARHLQRMSHTQERMPDALLFKIALL